MYCGPKVFYCICQPNELEREIKKKLGGKQGAKQKSLGGHGPPRPPLESPLPASSATVTLMCVEN